MNYQQLYEEVKSELAVKHGIILDINDPVILASFLQIKITAQEIEKIHEKYFLEIKSIKSKIEEDQSQYIFNLKENKNIFEEIFKKNLEIKLWVITPIIIISCCACLLIGKFIL